MLTKPLFLEDAKNSVDGDLLDQHVDHMREAQASSSCHSPSPTACFSDGFDTVTQDSSDWQEACERTDAVLLMPGSQTEGGAGGFISHDMIVEMRERAFFGALDAELLKVNAYYQQQIQKSAMAFDTLDQTVKKLFKSSTPKASSIRSAAATARSDSHASSSIKPHI